MKVDPQVLWSHLQRLRIPGPEKRQIQSVALRGCFESAAKTEDGSLYVQIPPLPDVDPLPREIGVDAKKLIWALGYFKRAEERAPGKARHRKHWLPSVDLSIEDRLVLSSPEMEDGGVLHLTFLRPDTLAGRAAEETMQNLVESIKGESGSPILLTATDWKGDPQPGDRREWARVAGRFQGGLKKREVILEGGREGLLLRGPIIGSANTSRGVIGEFQIPIPSTKVEKPSRMTFPAFPFLPVLERLRRANGAIELYLAGPEWPILLETDGYRYVLFSRESRRVLPTS